MQVANFEEVVEDADENTAGGNDEIHELTQKNAIILSPYRVNPSYRRPAAGTDSDHGYSTMTPMGDLDSEIVPYVDSTSARNRLQRLQKRSNNAPSSIQSMTSGDFLPLCYSNFYFEFVRIFFARDLLEPLLLNYYFS